MDWKAVGKAIMGFAPALGGALLGPPGAMAGTAVKAIAKALGEDEKTITPAKVLTRLQEQPEETTAKITQADLEYERELTKRLDIVNRTMRVEAKSACPRRAPVGLDRMACHPGRGGLGSRQSQAGGGRGPVHGGSGQRDQGDKGIGKEAGRWHSEQSTFRGETTEPTQSQWRKLPYRSERMKREIRSIRYSP